MTYSVSPRRKPKSVGPKPIENFSTFTPFHLARRKCPSSWMKITKPRPRATFETVIDTDTSQFRVSNAQPPAGPRRRHATRRRAWAADQTYENPGPRGRPG